MERHGYSAEFAASGSLFYRFINNTLSDSATVNSSNTSIYSSFLKNDSLFDARKF